MARFTVGVSGYVTVTADNPADAYRAAVELFEDARVGVATLDATTLDPEPDMVLTAEEAGLAASPERAVVGLEQARARLACSHVVWAGSGAARLQVGDVVECDACAAGAATS